MEHDLRVVELNKGFGSAPVVKDVSFDVAHGEYLCVLGPSGCGKTTTLRIIAGLEYPDSGRVMLAGEDVTDSPANRRQVNTVFQHYALFPHLNVADNIGFGMRLKKKGRDEITRAVKEMLALVSLAGYENRWPAQLSGGERQRVALARALVNEPVALLLDEPLGALDKRLRELMQRELKAIQKRTGITFIHVTHDQDEAMTLADRIAVMGGGRLLQIDKPQAVYDRPANRFVAGFIGDMNFVEARVLEHRAGQTLAETAGLPHVRAEGGEALKAGTAASLGIRLEKMRLHRPGETGADANAAEGEIADVTCLGSRFFVTVNAGSARVPLIVSCPAVPPGMAPGSRVSVSWSPRDTMLFANDPEDEGLRR